MPLRNGILLALACAAALVAPASAHARSAPEVETIGIHSLESGVAEVLGSVNPRGNPTQYRVEYGPASSAWCVSDGSAGVPESQTASTTLAEVNNSSQLVSVELHGLTSGSEYCGRIAAVNGIGSSGGAILRFTADAPAVQTLVGQPTGATTARVSGDINPVERATQYWVRYAPMASEWCQSGGASGGALDVTTPQALAETDSSTYAVSVDLTGLTPQTEYCAQLVAGNEAGTSGGDQVTFITDIPPVGLCDVTWKGGDGAWTDANWTFNDPATDANSDGYPDVEHAVCIPGGTVSLAGTETAAALRVSHGARLDVSGSLTVDNPGTVAPTDGGATVESGGTVQLTSTAALDSGLAGGTLTNSGTIRTLVGAGGKRTLAFGAIANGGGATLESNAATAVEAVSFTNSGAVLANGTVATARHTTLATAGHALNQNAGTIGGTGALVLKNGSYRHNGGDAASTVVHASGESLVLDGSGTGTVNAIEGTSSLSGNVAAGKTVNVLGGAQPATLALTGDRTNGGSIVLNNRAAGDGGAAKLDLGLSTLTNDGTVRARNVGAGAGTRVIAGSGTLANEATGTVDVDYDTTIEPHVTNAGMVDVADGATAQMTNFDLVQSAGMTALGGTLDLGVHALELQGGTLVGDGQVDGRLDNLGGTVNPGSFGPSELSVSGDFTQGPGGSLRIDVEGTDPGTGHDRLVVGGSASLGGTLLVDTDGFAPGEGDEFGFVAAAGALGGAFATESGMGLGGGRGYATSYAAGPPGSVKLTVVEHHALTVGRDGSGSGTVTSLPTGIDCGTACVHEYGDGVVVTLNAEAADDSRFTGWSGAGTEGCAGTTCEVTMSQARSVTASFARQRALIVSKTGSGSGLVSGGGIDCGTDCFDTVDQGATVVLTAAPAAGSRFAGWSGDCTGTGTCQVTMTRARSVTAVFTKVEVAPPAPPAPTPPAPSDPAAPADPSAPGGGTGEPAAPGTPSDPAPPSGPAPAAPAADDGDNRLIGTAAGEELCGLLGNDVLEAGAGDDTVFGDLCDAQPALPRSHAAAPGNDTLNGGAGDDDLYGGGGADRLSGDDGADRLFGGDGNDSLDGGRGKDTLDGGNGNDKLVGGTEANRYKAGAGDDKVDARNGKAETVDCGAGKKDSASVDRRDKVRGCEKVKRAKK